MGSYLVYIHPVLPLKISAKGIKREVSCQEAGVWWLRLVTCIWMKCQSHIRTLFRWVLYLLIHKCIITWEIHRDAVYMHLTESLNIVDFWHYWSKLSFMWMSCERTLCLSVNMHQQKLKIIVKLLISIHPSENPNYKLACWHNVTIRVVLIHPLWNFLMTYYWQLVLCKAFRQHSSDYM